MPNPYWETFLQLRSLPSSAPASRGPQAGHARPTGRRTCRRRKKSITMRLLRISRPTLRRFQMKKLVLESTSPFQGLPELVAYDEGLFEREGLAAEWAERDGGDQKTGCAGTNPN